MKRVIICAALFVLAVFAGWYAQYRVERVDDELAVHIEALGQTLISGDREELAVRAAELSVFWDKEEDVLIHFVRHSHIDLITTCAARLPSLAAYGDLGEFSAELANMRRQMEHIRSSEEISFANIF